jgi:hypothetical protein
VKTTKALIKLVGVRPLMFDRYPGDNSTQLKIQEKMYLTEKNEVMIPAINLYSMLIAENGKSAVKRTGKKWASLAQCVAAQTNIDPFEIPVLGGNEKQIIFSGFGGDSPFREHKSVARVKGGIPNPKARPVLLTPWSIQFTMEIEESSEISIPTIRNLFETSGKIGLGTFRPFFGRFNLAEFKIIE